MEKTKQAKVRVIKSNSYFGGDMVNMYIDLYLRLVSSLHDYMNFYKTSQKLSTLALFNILLITFLIMITSSGQDTLRRLMMSSHSIEIFP